MHRSLLSSLGLILLAGGLLVGCENQIEAPDAMTLQAKNAVEVLPAGARFVGMVDLQAMQRNTALDPFNRINTVNGEFGARVQAFLDGTGFDPGRDVREVYVAAAGLEPDALPSVVAYATFDRGRLQDYVDQRVGSSFERDDYQGVPVYRALEEGRTLTFALAADNMIVASPDEAAVEAMLDRLSGTGRALQDDAETMALIALVAHGSNAWAVVSDFDEQSKGPSHSEDAVERHMEQIGRALQDVAVAVTIQEDGLAAKVFMQTKEGVSAADVAALTKGVVAAMKADPDLDDEKLRVLDGVRVRTERDRVQVEFFADTAMLKSSE